VNAHSLFWFFQVTSSFDCGESGGEEREEGVELEDKSGFVEQV